MLCAGFSTREIATHFGRSNDWVAARIRELREDIVEQVTAND
jgi:transposase